MLTVRTLFVDAFTDEPFAGNGAGVVPDADQPDLRSEAVTARSRSR